MRPLFSLMIIAVALAPVGLVAQEDNVVQLAPLLSGPAPASTRIGPGGAVRLILLSLRFAVDGLTTPIISPILTRLQAIRRPHPFWR